MITLLALSLIFILISYKAKIIKILSSYTKISNKKRISLFCKLSGQGELAFYIGYLFLFGFLLLVLIITITTEIKLLYLGKPYMYFGLAGLGYMFLGYMFEKKGKKKKYKPNHFAFIFHIIIYLIPLIMLINK